MLMNYINESDAISMEVFAKLTYGEFKLGRNDLFKVLRKHGYVNNESTRPVKKHVIDGLFIEKNSTTRVTGKGRLVLQEVLANLKQHN